MSESGFDLKRDGLGIGLFALGAFFAVLGGYAVLVAMRSGADLASATGSGAVAQAWLSGIGVIPGLVLSVGVAFLGARIWLSGRAKRVVPQILAFAGLALATAVLAGALSPSAGGRFGFATGGLVAESVHPIAGMLAGALSIVAAVWFGWLRPAQSEDQDEPTLVQNPDMPDQAFEDLGVSPDEAAALIPEDFPRPEKVGRKQPRPPAVPPPSPYPEDVRRQGKIPAGARPLSSAATSGDAPPDVQPVVPSLAEGAAATATVYRWTAARTDRPVGAGEDLAAVPDAPASFDVDERSPAHGADEADPFALRSEGEVAAQALEPLPSPSWEQSNLFVVEDEPVDAYGTPLSLVDALRRSQEEVSQAFADPEGVGAAPLDAAGRELEEGDLDEEGEELEDDLAGELDEEDLEDEDPEDDADLEVEGELGEELEEELEESVVLEDEDELDGDLTEDLEEAVAQDEESELDPEEADVGLEHEPAEVRTEAPEAPERRIQPAAARADESAPEPRAAAAPMLPFQPAEAEAPVRPPARQRAAAQAARSAPAAEREVILQPQAVSAARASKPPLAADARGKLLLEAGSLFLDRGRVAVSMLQREYAMDFDEACRVLDELQDLGLIGPYLGGQRRDILMTREQWLERVAKV